MITYYLPAMFWMLGTLQQTGEGPARLDYINIQFGEQAINK